MCGKRGNKRCAKLQHIFPCEKHEGRYYSRYHSCVSCTAAAAREEKAAKQHAKAKAEVDENNDHGIAYHAKKCPKTRKLKHRKEGQSTEKNGDEQQPQRWEGRGKRKRKGKENVGGDEASHREGGDVHKEAGLVLTVVQKDKSKMRAKLAGGKSRRGS